MTDAIGHLEKYFPISKISIPYFHSFQLENLTEQKLQKRPETKNTVKYNFKHESHNFKIIFMKAFLSFIFSLLKNAHIIHQFIYITQNNKNKGTE